MLDGVVVREPDQHVLAPVQGTVRTVDVSLGTDVVAGETIATIELPPPPETPTPTPSPSPTPSASPSPTPTPSPSPSPTPVTVDVTAPMDGVVSEVAVVTDQQVAVGQAVVSVSPDSFDVIAPVGQALLPQFVDGPQGIQVSVSDGQPPFDCEFLSIGANLGSSGAQQVLNEAPDLRCHVPDEVVVVPGIRARAAATTGQVQNVVVLPVTAIERVDGQAYVWVVQGRTLTQTAVTLGISDGRRVEITGGLSGGQTVLNPVRGQAPTVSPSPSPTPSTSLIPSPSVSPSGSSSPAFEISPSPAPSLTPGTSASVGVGGGD
jgi:multidrug efflux pump subunit AcrA (membrane-fusion protein)